MSPTSTARRGAAERREEARERIAEAARDLLRDRPFSELTVDEVMRQAGMSRTVFYRHFDDLPSVLRRVGRTAVERLFETQATVAQAPEGTLGERLVTALELAVAVFEQHGPLIRAVVEAAAFDAALAEQHAALRARFRAVGASVIAASDARSADPAQTAKALGAMNETYLLEAFGREPKVDGPTAVRTLAEIWAVVLGVEIVVP